MSALRRKTRSRIDIEQQIRQELDGILPILRIEECTIELESFDPESGTASLIVRGGCPDCDVSPVTFMQGIETQLKLRIAELKTVTASVASNQ
ncbi:MAG TPA: NifU family protein [Gemmatimonadaceae bacterium]|nr:NifU family protein [Gemmatimonadaceae bacterium]